MTSGQSPTIRRACAALAIVCASVAATTQWTAAALAVAVAVPAAAQTSSAYFEFLMARRLESAGDYSGALAALERAARADPASAEVRAEIASFQLRRSRNAEAEDAAQAALKLDQDNVEAHRVLGLLYAANVDALSTRGDQAEIEAMAGRALGHLERISRDPAAGIEILFAMGRLYLRTGDAAKAVEAFNRVVTQNPGSLQARLSLAQAYAAQGDVKSAISTLDIIVDDEPRVASTLAQLQEQAGLFKEAAANYTRALALEPTNRGLKFRRAAVLLSAGDYTRAAALAAEAQSQHAEDPRFPRLRARALFEGGDAEQAIQILEPAARAFPRDTATQLALADLYNDIGRDADAERMLRRLLEEEPANAQILNHLGYMLSERGRQLDEAVRLVQRALDVEPDNPYYLDSLGWAYFRRGNLDEAEKYLSPAAAQLPNNSEVQDHLGELMARRGRWADAIAAWTRALDGNGGVDRSAIEKKIQDAQGRLPR